MTFQRSGTSLTKGAFHRGRCWPNEVKICDAFFCSGLSAVALLRPQHLCYYKQHPVACRSFPPHCPTSLRPAACPRPSGVAAGAPAVRPGVAAPHAGHHRAARLRGGVPAQGLVGLRPGGGDRAEPLSLPEKSVLVCGGGAPTPARSCGPATVQRLWIGYTFYDGFAALTPRCRVRAAGQGSAQNGWQGEELSEESCHPQTGGLL